MNATRLGAPPQRSRTVPGFGRRPLRGVLLGSAAATGLLLATACVAPGDEDSAAAAGAAALAGCDAGAGQLTVRLTAPATNATVSGSVTLQASATGDVRNLEFFDVRGALLGRAALTNVAGGVEGRFAWDSRSASNGPIQIFARAWNVPPGVSPFVEVSSAPIALTVQNSTSPCGTRPADAIDVRTHGAVSSTTADNQAALQRAFTAAKAAGKAVFVPAGTFRHSGQLVLDGVDLWGEGPASVLVGLDPASESLNVRGTRGGVHAVKLVSGAPSRLTTPWSAMIWVDRASQFDIGCVTVEGSASNAVIALESTSGKIHDNVATRTLADAIHLTRASNQIEVMRNHIEYAGDDGIACVSYEGVAPGNGPETSYVRDVKAWDNVILYNRGGRAMSVVGGRRIEYWNNYLRGGTMQTACIYLAQEGSYDTWEANGVHVHDNRLIECGGTVHPASLLVYAGQWPNRDIRIENNSFWRNRGGSGAVALQGTNINVTQTGTRGDVGAIPPVPF